jgi:hypothetical protein
MSSYAYSTDEPEILAAFREAAAAMADYLPRLREEIATIGGAKNPLVFSGMWGSPDELVALEPDGSGVIPDGWRMVRSRLEPRRGGPGEGARKWLADHQPPDIRHTLAAHGLPRHAYLSSPSGGFRLIPPVLFEHDGSLWACYDGEPGRGYLDDGKPCTWTPRRLSEFHAAKEAREAEKIGAKGE